MSEPEQVSAAEDYWETRAGCKVRLEMLSEDLTYKSYNNAVHAYGSENGVKGFFIRVRLDERTCTTCKGYIDGYWRAGQFMPELPAHPSCRCYYDFKLE